MDENYIKAINEWQDSIVDFKGKLGYALTHCEKRGIRAKLWRKIGRLFHRRDWYIKGMEKYNPISTLWGLPIVTVDDITKANDLLESAEK